MSIRDLRDRARAQLHRAMQTPAVYVAPDRSSAIDCSVRVHARTKPFGDMTGFDYQPAQRITPVPEIVALAAEVMPARGGVFVLAADEVYEVETRFPVDGITVTVEVTRMDAADIAAGDFPLPGDDLTGWTGVP